MSSSDLISVSVFFLGSLLGGIGGFYLRHFLKRDSVSREKYKDLIREKEFLSQKHEDLKNQEEKAREQESLLQEQVQTLTNDKIRTEEKNKYLEEKLNHQKEELDSMNQKLLKEFENLSNRIQKENSESFRKRSTEDITSILKPFKEDIEKFEKKTDEAREKHIQETTSLKDQINQMQKSNQTLFDHTQGLTTALKGESKTQGDWGEMSLELLLQNAGLQKGEHYRVQETFQSDEGERFRPDVIVNLPDKKHLIIDSKVSLKDFMDYNQETDEKNKESHLKKHIQSVRNHIRDLSRKNYENLYQINSPDFVIMFLALEPAFILAVSQDNKIHQEAMEQNICIIAPSMLLATLRIVYHIWKQEAQNQNAKIIAETGGKLYDKLSAFVGDLEGVGKSIESSQKSYNEAYKKLHAGRGNAIGLAEKLKELGVSSKKKITISPLNAPEP